MGTSVTAYSLTPYFDNPSLCNEAVRGLLSREVGGGGGGGDLQFLMKIENPRK